MTQLVRDHQHILARGFTPLAELSTSTPPNSFSSLRISAVQASILFRPTPRSEALTQLVCDHQRILARGFTPLAELSTSTPPNSFSSLCISAVQAFVPFRPTLTVPRAVNPLRFELLAFGIGSLLLFAPWLLLAACRSFISPHGHISLVYFTVQSSIARLFHCPIIYRSFISNFRCTIRCFTRYNVFTCTSFSFHDADARMTFFRIFETGLFYLGAR